MAGSMEVGIRNLGSDPPAQPFIPEGLWAGPWSLLHLEFSTRKTANNTSMSQSS